MSMPYNLANVRGPLEATVMTPKTVVNLIKRAKRPMLIVGSNALKSIGDKAPIDYAIELAKKTGVSVVAAAHTVKGFIERDFEPSGIMGVADITNRIIDPDWKGLDGNGGYDVVFYLGGPYYFQTQILSSIKHGAPSIKAVSLDRFYDPNATFSFGNLTVDEWKTALDEILKLL
ncbi:MAG: CO dehydrogenase/acetyl-CoA synthase complex subunit epsilon [Promethearchaeota archaeon]